jgi:hypothetical protein
MTTKPAGQTKVGLGFAGTIARFKSQTLCLSTRRPGFAVEATGRLVRTRTGDRGRTLEGRVDGFG